MCYKLLWGYNGVPLTCALDNIKHPHILEDTGKIIGRMYKNKDCIDFIYIPVDCVCEMDYVILAINCIIGSFGYEASWDCLNYVDVGGKYCIHLYLEEL